MNTSATEQPTAKYLKDYQAPHYTITQTNLNIELDDAKTTVTGELHIQKLTEQDCSLILDMEVDELLQVEINGEATNDYKICDGELIINVNKEKFVLTTISHINPENNKALEGLYKSAGVFCTQCEAEGFRKITPYLDRPDVLSVFTVSITADTNVYPHVLANGNLIAKQKDTKTGLTTVTWHDPFPKPSYLFAMVAGDFDLLEDSYKTMSGRSVSLELYVDKGNLHLAEHAMSSLKKSMQWDEQKYGLEYDLDSYMIVAVDFFNMGAMENKGLNIFNSKYVLADAKTATDTDYHGVESVIAHEYFHNWTGNRVTCRDWFQLSLKEGLTVFRDQQFSADMGSPVIERINHANVIRTMQFAEDAGPMAHPIRPEKVIEMNNFYTVTVYDKGAEVIRMYHTLLGKDGFRKGMDHYFSLYDGQAVTCDDFLTSMATANDKDLSQFARWYQQKGTPMVSVKEQFSEGKLVVDFSQSIPSVKNFEHPLVIPIKYELLDRATGESIKRDLFVLDEMQQSLEVQLENNVDLVLFEDFSAPVRVQRELSIDSMKNIILNATDHFCRWDMLQSLWLEVVNKKDGAFDALQNVLGTILVDNKLDLAVKGQLLTVPSYQSLAEAYDVIPVDNILSARKQTAESLAIKYQSSIQNKLLNMAEIEPSYSASNVGARNYRASLLKLVAYSQADWVEQQTEELFNNAKNMTERMDAVQAASIISTKLLKSLLDKLYIDFKGQVLVFDKVLQTVASTNSEDIYELMKEWASREEFDRTNPNRMRSLYGAFVMRNPAQFHHSSGRGYEFLGKLLKEIDSFNPQLAARLIDPLINFNRYDEHRKTKMITVLKEMKSQSLSKDVFEKVASALS